MPSTKDIELAERLAKLRGEEKAIIIIMMIIITIIITIMTIITFLLFCLLCLNRQPHHHYLLMVAMVKAMVMMTIEI